MVPPCETNAILALNGPVATWLRLILYFCTLYWFCPLQNDVIYDVIHLTILIITNILPCQQTPKTSLQPQHTHTHTPLLTQRSTTNKKYLPSFKIIANSEKNLLASLTLPFLLRTHTNIHICNPCWSSTYTQINYSPTPVSSLLRRPITLASNVNKVQ